MALSRAHTSIKTQQSPSNHSANPSPLQNRCGEIFNHQLIATLLQSPIQKNCENVSTFGNLVSYSWDTFVDVKDELNVLNILTYHTYTHAVGL